MWSIIVDAVLIVALWWFYLRISRFSYSLGIVRDPFRNPSFYLTVAATIACLIAITLEIFDSIETGF